MKVRPGTAGAVQGARNAANTNMSTFVDGFEKKFAIRVNVMGCTFSAGSRVPPLPRGAEGPPGVPPPPQTFFAFPGLKWSLISDPAKRRLVALRGTRVWETTPPAASLPGSGHPIVAIPQNQAQCIQSNVLGNPFELSKV